MSLSTHKDRIYYQKVGNGPHLSFLHGFCENHTIWDVIVEHLKTEYTCLLIDLPGFGQSDLEKTQSIADYARIVKSILDREGIEQTTLIGHSMGGYISLEFLSQFPAQVEALALVHSTACADSDEKKESREKLIHFLETNEKDLFLKNFIRGLVSEINFERLRILLWELVKTTTKPSIITATRAMLQRKDHRDTLENCDIPVLFLAGDQDAHIPLEDILEQVSSCDLAQINVIKATGHLSLFENPSASLKSISDFLEFSNKNIHNRS